MVACTTLRHSPPWLHHILHRTPSSHLTVTQRCNQKTKKLLYIIIPIFRPLKITSIILLHSQDPMCHPETMEVEAGKICLGAHNAVVIQSLAGDALGSWYEGCRCSVIKMVLQSLTLFPHRECNIEVIPYYQECLSADKSNNLKKPLLAKIFNFVNCSCVRQRKSGMVQNIELCLRGTTCK